MEPKNRRIFPLGTWGWVCGGAAMLGVASSPALAQHDDQPEDSEHRAMPAHDPELDDPTLDDDVRMLERQGDGDDRVRPTVRREQEPSRPGLPGPLEALPGLEGADYLLRSPSIRSEGVFLAMQRGTVLRGRGGEWWFVFHRDAQGRAQRPMMILPCQTLERMSEASAAAAAPVFRATGQVFVYYGRNYFLPTTAVLAAGPEPTVQLEGPPDPEASAGPGEVDEEPTIESLIEELSGAGEQARALGAQTRGGGEAGAASGLEAVSEGTLMARRRGRMVRQGAAWVFVFDNDGDRNASRERPMVLTPCLNLEAMEKIAAKQGDAVVFEMSGRVLEFRGRNYLIPTIFQVVRDREVRPLQ